jgi:hypothetical protein
MTNLAIVESKTEIKQQLRCSGCGATTDAACACGVGYVPAHEYAAKAVAANPGKSDRAIAAELGLDHKTVGKARRSTGEKSPVEKRVGQDGKVRRLPKRRSRAQSSAPSSRNRKPAALILSQIERLVGDLAAAVEKGVRSEIFDGRVRAVADRMTLIAQGDNNNVN